MSNKIKTYPFTFKDTGVTIEIKKVSPDLQKQIRLDMRATMPKPPVQRVNRGTETEPEWTEEVNEASTDYQDKMRDWQAEVSRRTRLLFFERGVVLILDKDQQQEVDELKKWWKDNFKSDLPGSDKEIYVTRICTGTDEDVDELIAALTRRSIITQEEIAAQQDSFRGEVQR